MNKYFIECMGVITIVYAFLLTDKNPAIMGMIYFAMFTIAEQNSGFNPLTTFGSYLIGRLPFEETLYYVAAQTVGMLAVAVSFLPIKTYIDIAS
jgi:glycerol uptake facilitator-like aquaporin